MSSLTSRSSPVADEQALLKGRRFSSADVQIMLLGLVAQQPRHGYELIKALEQLSMGAYKPSPGMIYPALGALQKRGYVCSVPEGNKKCFHPTDAGRAYLEACREQGDMLFGGLAHLGRKISWVRRALAGQPPELGADGSDRQTGWLPEYVEARDAMRRELIKSSGATPAEQRRVAAILRQAVACIRGDHEPAPASRP